jgi:hypothetical protein
VRACVRACVCAVVAVAVVVVVVVLTAATFHMHTYTLSYEPMSIAYERTKTAQRQGGPSSSQGTMHRGGVSKLQHDLREHISSQGTIQMCV